MFVKLKILLFAIKLKDAKGSTVQKSLMTEQETNGGPQWVHESELIMIYEEHNIVTWRTEAGLAKPEETLLLGND